MTLTLHTRTNTAWEAGQRSRTYPHYPPASLHEE